MKKILVLLITLIMLLPTAVGVLADDTNDVTVLFTHDLHSHLLPSVSEEGGEFGGYARLMTVIKEQREKYPDAILVDGGDFSMGSLFQTAYPTSAIELRMMGAMGYDATTFGNHEFDYLPEGLISMLGAAKLSGETLPAIVDANYLPAEDDVEMQKALDDYGVKDHIILERGGAYFVIFGIFGIDSDACAPNSGMILKDAVETAQTTVDKAVKECKESYGAEPVVICLSHAGTSEGKGEDYELAEKVNGIDLIISGHTHTTLEEAIEVNGTYIVSAAEYGKNLGVVNLTIEGDRAELKDYSLIPINEKVAEDEEIAERVEQFKSTVESDYLSKYGVTYDQVVLNNEYRFDSVDEVYATQHESTLGNLFSDAYKWAIEKATGEKVDAALTAAGVVRETVPVGDVTVSDIFNAASLGVGTEGELIKVYVTGAELKNALEVDASVQPLMSAAQLFFSGVEYSFNTNRMLFNKVDYAMLRTDEGLVEIEDDKMYSVVTGMYAGQMLGSVKEKSFGLLSITPKNEKGEPIPADELVNYVVRDENGNPVKEWYAITSYMQEMGGEMDEAYGKTDGRKAVYSSLNPADLLRAANKFTYTVLVLILALTAAVVLTVIKAVRRIKKKRK